MVYIYIYSEALSGGEQLGLRKRNTTRRVARKKNLAEWMSLSTVMRVRYGSIEPSVLFLSMDSTSKRVSISSNRSAVLPIMTDKTQLVDRYPATFWLQLNRQKSENLKRATVFIDQRLVVVDL